MFNMYTVDPMVSKWYLKLWTSRMVVRLHTSSIFLLKAANWLPQDGGSTPHFINIFVKSCKLAASDESCRLVKVQLSRLVWNCANGLGSKLDQAKDLPPCIGLEKMSLERQMGLRPSWARIKRVEGRRMWALNQNELHRQRRVCTLVRNRLRENLRSQ